MWSLEFGINLRDSNDLFGESTNVVTKLLLAKSSVKAISCGICPSKQDFQCGGALMHGQTMVPEGDTSILEIMALS